MAQQPRLCDRTTDTLAPPKKWAASAARPRKTDLVTPSEGVSLSRGAMPWSFSPCSRRHWFVSEGVFRRPAQQPQRIGRADLQVCRNQTSVRFPARAAPKTLSFLARRGGRGICFIGVAPPPSSPTELTGNNSARSVGHRRSGPLDTHPRAAQLPAASKWMRSNYSDSGSVCLVCSPRFAGYSN